MKNLMRALCATALVSLGLTGFAPLAGAQTADTISVQVDRGGERVTVTGTNGADEFSITGNGGNIVIEGIGATNVSLDGGQPASSVSVAVPATLRVKPAKGADVVTVSGVNVQALSVKTGRGADVLSVSNASASRANFVGGKGTDSLNQSGNQFDSASVSEFEQVSSTPVPVLGPFDLTLSNNSLTNAYDTDFRTSETITVDPAIVGAGEVFLRGFSAQETTFSAPDQIDLSAIDADATRSGNQAFTLVPSFTGRPGELTMEINAPGERNFFQRMEGDTNGDGVADLRITFVTTARVILDISGSLIP